MRARTWRERGSVTDDTDRKCGLCCDISYLMLAKSVLQPTYVSFAESLPCLESGDNIDSA